MNAPLRNLLAIVLVIALGTPTLAVVRPALTLEYQAVLLCRVLAYDRRISRLPGALIKLAVVFRAGDPLSEQAANRVSAELEKTAALYQISDKRLIVQILPFDEPVAFLARLQKARPVVLYLCPGLDEALASLLRESRKTSALTITGSEAFMRQGTSIALVMREESAKLVINLATARAEGSDLDVALLRIAEIYP